MIHKQHIAVVAACLLLSHGRMSAKNSDADYSLNYAASLTANAGSGTFAPYYVMSNQHGLLTQGGDVLGRVAVWHALDKHERLSYGYGVDVVGGYGSSADYLQYEDGDLTTNSQHPAAVWIQQLYGEVKYRGVFLTIGAKEHGSALLNQRLSSGDLVESGNARPIPEARIGFVDFQNIPFTNGWLQIQGEISYGKFTDNAWMRNHYNYYQQHLNQGALYTYKRCYFRTNPSQPLSATFGMQVGGLFGGSTSWYYNGRLISEVTYAKGLKQFFKMFFPTEGGVSYYTGSSLGSWDVLFAYKLRNGMELRGYFQKPWEDGSGIGFLNGFDGVWGLELRTHRRGIVNAAVVEYVDFTNQSGPSHWDYDDHPGSNLQVRAEGADDYYNNHEYNPYANYGMAIGTPFMVSPIYNQDGCMMFLYNRMRGFHIGLEGDINKHTTYRLLGGYRESVGSGYQPLIDKLGTTSLMAEAGYTVPSVAGLKIQAQVAMDHGSLLGNNFGGCVTVSYTGALNF
jgi:hypothetical protein